MVLLACYKDKGGRVKYWFTTEKITCKPLPQEMSLTEICQYTFTGTMEWHIREKAIFSPFKPCVNTSPSTQVQAFLTFNFVESVPPWQQTWHNPSQLCPHPLPADTLAPLPGLPKTNSAYFQIPPVPNLHQKCYILVLLAITFTMHIPALHYLPPKFK